MTILANPALPLWCAFCQDNHTMDFVDCKRLKLEFPTMGGDLGRKPTEEEKAYALKSGYAWDNEKACYMDTVLGGRKPETFAEWREKKMAAIVEAKGPELFFDQRKQNKTVRFERRKPMEGRGPTLSTDEKSYKEQLELVYPHKPIEYAPHSGPIKKPLQHISAGAAMDDISNPGYYKRGAMEAIDVVEAFDLGFHLGNAFKYMARRGLKPGAREVDDLRKSKWYIDREIARLERG